MQVLGSLTVILSDDPAYEEGSTYQVLLQTPPAPVTPITGTLDADPVVDTPVTDTTSATVDPNAGQ